MNCRLCGSNKIKQINWGGTILLHCNSCDIYFLAEFPNQLNLDNYYEKEYRIVKDFTNTEHRRISRIYEQYQLLSIINKYHDIKSILDIGCDKGFFLDEARRLGINVAGVELSESARNYCATIGLDVRHSIDEFDSKFDAVIMSHSLEHFFDPKEILTKIYDKLNSKGLLIVRVPAFDSPWSRIAKSRWIWFQPKNHNFHFTQKSLRLLAQNCGFEVLEIQYRKSNNLMTKRFTKLSRKAMQNLIGYRASLRQKIGNFVENTMGVELLMIATKQSISEDGSQQP